MLNSLRSLFFPSGEITETLFELAKLLNVNIVKHSLEQELTNHPNFPSLLSVSDVLEDFGIPNVSLKVTALETINIPTFFLAQINVSKKFEQAESAISDTPQERNEFILISEVNREKIKFFEPTTRQWKTDTFNNFSEKFTGIVFIAEAGDIAGEKDHSQKQRAQNISEYSYFISFLAIPVLTLAAGVYNLQNLSTTSVAATLNVLLMCFGSVVSFLLLLYEYDEYNPVLKEICTSSKNTDCKAVIGSKYSQIIGISWSTIGFFYFSSCTWLLLMKWNDPNIAKFISWASLLSLPYTIFSIYYQARVIKQWCKLCLTIQMILVASFLTNLSEGSFGRININIPFAISVLTSFSVTFIAISIIIPLLKRVKSSQHYKRRFTDLIRNPKVFDSLLNNQIPVSYAPDGIGIVLGNKSAKDKIIKVCNPYCGPCSKSHRVLEELLASSNDVQIQIIFNATPNAGDHKIHPVRHFLAIAETNNETKLRSALNDWYEAETKNYDEFAKNYPVTSELHIWDNQVASMRKWCDENYISATPTIFVNGHLLPEIYSSGDLKYLLRSDNFSSGYSKMNNFII